MHRHVGAAMMPGVGNHVPFEPEAADHDRTLHRPFVDRAEFCAVERPGQAGTQGFDHNRHAQSLIRPDGSRPAR